MRTTQHVDLPYDQERAIQLWKEYNSDVQHASSTLEYSQAVRALAMFLSDEQVTHHLLKLDVLARKQRIDESLAALWWPERQVNTQVLEALTLVAGFNIELRLSISKWGQTAPPRSTWQVLLGWVPEGLKAAQNKAGSSVKFIMSNSRRAILVVGGLTIIGMLLFPPWVHRAKTRARIVEHPYGYFFILDQKQGEQRLDLVELSVDGGRLFVQCLAVGAIVAGLLFATRTWSK